MSYEIVYEISGSMKRLPRWKKTTKWITAVFAAFVLLAAFLMPLHTQWRSTWNALDGFANNLGQGSGIADAFSEFCIDILNDAEIK